MTSFYSDLTASSEIDCQTVYTDNLTLNSELDLTAPAYIIGDVLPNVTNTYNLGSATKKWANIYTNGSFNGPTINVDNINSYTPNTNITLTADGTGYVQVNNLLKAQSIELTSATNQIVIQPNDTSTFFIVRANGNPSASRTLTLPDISNGTFLINTGNQSITGDTTFNGVIYSNGSIQSVNGTNLNLSTVNPSDQISLGRNTVQTATYQFTSDLINVNTLQPRGVVDLKLTNSSGLILVDSTNLRITSGNSLQLTSQVSPLKTTNIFSRGSTTNRDYYVPDVTTNADFVMTEGTQSINGTKSFVRIDSNQIIVKDVGASDGLYIENTGGTYTTRITAQDTATNRHIIIPESTFAGTNYFVISGPDSYINGTKSFTSSVNLQSASNQLVFCLPLTTTLNVSPPTFPITNRTVNLTDPGANSNILLSEGNQSMTGIQTITNTTNSTSTTTGALIVNGGSAINKSLYVGTTSATDGIVFNNNVASYSPSVLNFYETGTFNTTFNCRNANSGTVTYSIVRIGKLVTMLIPSFTFTSGSSAVTNTNVLLASAGLSARFRPTQARQEIANCTVEDNGNKTNGLLHVLSSGNIEIYKNVTVGVFAVSLTVGLTYGAVGSWVV